jgi:hypothetical protein
VNDPKDRAAKIEKARREAVTNPLCLFAMMLRGSDTGDAMLASKAQQKLHRLGFNVTIRAAC